MSQSKLSNEFLSAFCMELSTLIHAGVTVSEGLPLLAGDAPAQEKELLIELSQWTDLGEPLSRALDKSGVFPDYVVQMVSAGELSGKLEEALHGLSLYYDSRQRLNRRIRTALLYPAILTVLMLAVLVVLLVKVLPVFDQVYRQLGTRLTGLGGGLLRFGQGLKAALPALLVILAAVVAAALVCALVPSVRGKVLGWARRRTSGHGVARKVAQARFASAMSMGLSSGLSTEATLELAASFQKEDPDMLGRSKKCLELLDGGLSLGEALEKAGVLPQTYCRMIGLGMRGGAGDQMMAEVALRMEEDAEEAIERAVGRVEPALVICSSLLVGVVILAVMLPLMDVMSTIG